MAIVYILDLFRIALIFHIHNDIEYWLGMLKKYVFDGEFYQFRF